MDMDKYMSVFVAECRELIETLNLSIVQLEQTPDDDATIDEIFRVAHSLKGIASTMGFDLMAGLTHDMEHLLDIVRSGGRAADAELVTVLLACLDLLEQSVDGIEHNGVEGIDPAPIVARLQALASSTDDAPAQATAATEAAGAADSVTLPDPASLPEGLDLLRVRVDVDPSCDSASIRAYMAWSAVDQVSEPVWSVPTPDELDTWEHPWVELLVSADGAEQRAAIRSALERIPELATIVVEPWPASSNGDRQGAGGDPALIVPRANPSTHPQPDPLPVAVPASAAAPVAVDARIAPTRSGSSAAPAAAFAAPVAAPPEPAAVPAAAPPPAAPAAGSGMKQRKSGTVRVDASRLDTLMHLMGEVVVHRSAVEAMIRDQDLPGAAEAVQELRRSTQSLQAEVMNVRMVPVETAFVRLPRLVRDLSSKLGKEVQLAITGADTEIDRSVVDALGEPLVHLVRNAIDHGIEPGDEREAAGKTRVATLGIGAEHSGGNVVISVVDDGRGIDPARVRARAVERGIITPEEALVLDDRGAVELVFRAGFSTAEVATDVSGRGVGMDAVRVMCREWGGDIEIESRFGSGSVARIRIPLTLAVMTVLVVNAGENRVAIPIDRIERTIRLEDSPRVDVGGGNRMIRLDEGVLSEFDLATAVGYGSEADPRFGVIVRGAGDRRAVLAVGSLVGEHEAVTKPLPRAMGTEAAFMGAAVQGDGSVVLIVDCDHLVEGVGREPSPAPVAAGHSRKREGDHA